MKHFYHITEFDKAKQNILIVDDEPANTLLLKKILATKGYTNVMTTLDPIEVVPLHLEHNFELILPDINTPEMNGYEVLKQLRNTDYIIKIMKMNVLLETVEKALQKNIKIN